MSTVVAKGSVAKSSYVRMLLVAGKATPAPPVGPALGQRGVNLVEFCKQFNALSSSYDSSMPLRLIVAVTPDKKFSIKILGHPTTSLIKNRLGLEKCSTRPGTQVVATLSREDVEFLLPRVMESSGARTKEAALNILTGTARSMGIKVEGEI